MAQRPGSSPLPWSPLANLAKGVGLGLFIATVFSAWVTIAGSGSRESLGVSYRALVGMYYTAGLAGGLIVGLAWPLSRHLLGAGLLGVLGMFPLYLGAGMLQSPTSQWWSLDNISTAGFIALMVGYPVGMALWFKDNPAPPWIKALLYPSAVLVRNVWLVAIPLAGGSLLLTKWTGSWPFGLVVLTVLGLFALPLGLALFVTFRRGRSEGV